MKAKKTEPNETEPSGYARESRPEKVVARLRPHARVLAWPTLLLFALAGGTGYFFGNLPEPWQNATLLAGAILLALLGWLLPLAAWLTKRYTITTRRIIFRHGFFVRTRQELLHSRGYDVSVRQNWLQAGFHSGTVLINSGLEHPLVLKDLPNVDLVQSTLHDLMEQASTVMGSRRQEQSALSEESAFWGRR
ncbi:PH domain-containing protein [Cryobacterium sp. TMT1-2-2]|uniref:PH domain-containing protein n=1 Tax=Cryobacterium sp. TMT1-2-2 TaxID=1259233 RepID=UPI00106A7997|nr:PH domain-containing protein [Cryobacterium sp. TMT1-2-2]TFD09639.1 PH domain-containing protein [Cryobacterium sp. TMT1-2-2]